MLKNALVYLHTKFMSHLEFLIAGMTKVKEVDVSYLMGHLCQHSFKWNVIGTALHFLPGELENIRHNHQDVQQRLNAVLCQWVQWPTTAHPQTPTMEMFRDALRSNLVGLGAVANQLYDTRNQLPSQCVSPPPSLSRHRCCTLL